MKLRNILIMTVILLVLGVFFFIFNSGPEPEPLVEPRPFVWSFEFGELKKIAISLPQEGKRESWVKHEDKYWYFDQSNGPKVNMERWGGGIPLLLSGPGAERLITVESTADQLKMYGLEDPRMKIDLILESKDAINIVIGDRTPDAQAYYVKAVDSGSVYSVDHTWYEVLERLVLEPPYPEPEEK